MGEKDIDNWAMDICLGELAEAQKVNGYLPTPVENRQFLQGVFADLDGPQADRAKKNPPRTDPRVRKDADELVAEEGWELIRGADVEREVLAKRAKRNPNPIIEAKLKVRINQLKEKPEWAARLFQSCAMGTGIKLRELNQADHKGISALWKVIEDSNATFGDWQDIPIDLRGN